MAQNAYITLANSNASLTKRFRVIATGYRPLVRKTGVSRRTITGTLDHQVAPLDYRWEFEIKVYETESDANYGTLAQLQTLFELNDPSPGAGATNVITFTDFNDANSYSVYIVGDFMPKPVTSTIFGTAAEFRVPITMVKTT